MQGVHSSWRGVKTTKTPFVTVQIKQIVTDAAFKKKHLYSRLLHKQHTVSFNVSTVKTD